MLSLLVITLLGSAYADNICCFPRQYHATQRLTKMTVTSGRASVLTGTLQYWKDSDSHRETFLEDLDIDGYKTKVKVVIDQNVTMSKYVITGTHCTKKAPKHWKDGCVPAWGHLLEESYFGRKGDGLTFSNYDTSAGSAKNFITVDKASCFPMFDTTIVSSGASPYMQTVQLHNFTVGIPDRSIFDIPTQCDSAHVLG